MKIIAILLTILIILSPIHLIGQTTRHVPSQYATIQAGLNAAQSGDVVLVQPGTYTENVMWPNRNGIKLLSAGDSSSTVINGNNISSAISIFGHGLIDSTTQISGFKITSGGGVQYGGGIYIDSASPKLFNLNFVSNKASSSGGGIYVKNGNLFVFSCIFNNNFADISIGGTSGGAIGISLNGNKFSIIGCSFFDNKSNSYGGAIYLNGLSGSDSGSISNSNFYSNTCLSSQNISALGGAIFSSITYTEINDCVFRDNHVNTSNNGGQGGAVSTSGNSFGASSLFVNNSKFLNNSADIGGALYLQGSTIIENTIFYKNSAILKGGALYAYNSVQTNNVVFSENKTISESDNIDYDGKGGAIYFVVILPNTHLTKSTFIKNISRNGGSIYSQLLAQNGSLIDFSNFICNVGKNQTGGILFGDQSIIQIHNSNFISNGTAIKNPSNSTFVDAIINYWGSGTGPFHAIQNSAGQGDSVNLFVNVTPFLTSPDTSTPSIPVQNFRMTNITNNSIAFTWDPSQLSNLASYKIYWDTDSSGYPYSNSQSIGNGSSFTLANLTAGQQYYFALTCINNSGNESWYSNEIAAKPIPPVLSVLDISVQFPATAITDSSFGLIRIKSGNSSPLIISSLTNANSSFVPQLNLPYTINTTDTLKLKIRFKPSSFGSSVDTLKVITNGGNSGVILRGESPYPVISSNPNAFNFGTVVRNTSASAKLTFRNSSINTLIIDSIYVHSSVFSVSSSSGVVSNNDSLNITVRFYPTEFGVFKDTIEVMNNSTNHTLRIPLVGSTPIQIVLTGGNINFGNVPLSDSLSQDLLLSNIFNSPLTIDSIFVKKSQFSTLPNHAIVNPLDTLKLKVLFIPSNFGVIQDTLYFYSAGQGIFLKLGLNGTSPFPVFIANTDNIKFDSTVLNTTVTKSFYIKNSSINNLTLDSIYFGKNKFSISSVSTRLVKRGDSSLVTISFHPQILGLVTDTLYFVNNSISVVNKIVITGIGKNLTGIETASSSVPKNYFLFQNHPNPFNPSTIIRYTLPYESIVKLQICNSLGQIISELENSIRSAGYHEVNFDASLMSSGVFFYAISAKSVDGKNEYHSVKKMLFLK